jgi:hypothetical protein
MRQYLYAGLFAAAGILLSLVALASGFVYSPSQWPVLPVDFSFVLISVVALLAVEWLTRKLLKLA